MSPTLERVAKEFAALTPVEKIEFLKSVTPSAPGEWIELDGEILFIPYDDEPWTEEDEEAWQEGMRDIDEGKFKTLEQVKKELNNL